MWRQVFFTVGASSSKLFYTVDYEVVKMDGVEYATLLDQWSLAKNIDPSPLAGLEGGQ